MAIKHYQLYCDNCHYKRITDGSDIDDLRLIPSSPIQKTMPQIDPQAKVTNIVNRFHQPAVNKIEIKPSTFVNQKKKFKCPKCGFAIRAKQIKVEENNEQTNRTDGRETGSQGQTIS